MIFLILNILFASAFMLFIKWAQVREREDVVTIGTINYIVAAVLIAPFFFSADAPVTQAAVGTGATMGSAYFIAYFFVIYAIKWVGASSATVISVLSLLVPIGFGIFCWGDQPNAWQVVGIGLAVASLLLIGGQKKESKGSVEKPWFAPIMLVLFFLLCGLSRLAQDAFGQWCQPDEKMTFNFAAFAVAAIPSLVVMIVRRVKYAVRVSRSEWAFGFAMGTVNFLQTQFILESLQRFPGFIVFPVVSAGGVILTMLVATQTLGEKLTVKSYIGISIATVALVLLNVAVE